MNIEKAKFARGEDGILPYVRVNGVWYLCETKETLVDLGVAIMLPREDDLVTYAAEPVEHFWAVCPASEKWGILYETIIQDATNNLSIWKIAKRYWEQAYLGKGGHPVEGEIEIPTFTEEEYKERAKFLGV